MLSGIRIRLGRDVTAETVRYRELAAGRIER